MDVPRAPGGTVRTPKEALAEGQRLLDAGMPFHAHEVLEDSWKSAEQDERQLWRGLAQLAVGLTHAARGNPAGAAALLARGAANMAPYGANAPHGIDVAGLTHWAADAVAQLGERPSDPVPVPRLRARSS
jgi:hypothetical protein